MASKYGLPVYLDIANGLITSFFKPRNGGFHSGLDFRTIADDDGDITNSVRAVADGTVVRASYNDTSGFSLGYVIILYHGQETVVRDGESVQRHVYSVYAHLGDRSENSEPFAEGIFVGANVEGGALLGDSGDTGGVNIDPG